MAERMRTSFSRSTLLRIGVVLLVGGVGLSLFIRDESESDRETPPGSLEIPAARPPLSAPSPVAVPTPSLASATKNSDHVFRIEAHGRLTLTTADLRDHDSLRLELSLDEAARSARPLETVIVSHDLRRLETLAHPRDSEGDVPQIRLEVDTAFLQVGRYLIQVNSAGRDPLSLRRFILEITE